MSSNLRLDRSLGLDLVRASETDLAVQSDALNDFNDEREREERSIGKKDVRDSEWTKGARRRAREREAISS
jgi:hypothetical protein